MRPERPLIEDAPGLVWKPRRHGWEARWQGRTDLIARGYEPKSARIWFGTTPNETEAGIIRERCQRLQDEMIIWGRGGATKEIVFTGTIRSLIDCYQRDADSPYHTARFASRRFYDDLCKRISADCGNEEIRDIDIRRVKRLYEGWSAGGKMTMGHSCVRMLRIILTFGKVYLGDRVCKDLREILHDVRFTMPKPRSERLTADQAAAIIAKAHDLDRSSISLAQAFQFDCMFRQKDAIGEWVPISESGLSDVTAGPSKWLRGIRWEEIDDNLILRHTTSKRLKDIEVNLTLAPMVMAELCRTAGVATAADLTRDKLPANGPVIVSEWTGLPWEAGEYRRWWRKLARLCGVPDAVRSMDSRAGAITEATEAGAELEHIKHAATHSDIQMTQRYARAGAEKTAGVMRQRVAHRNASKTK